MVWRKPTSRNKVNLLDTVPVRSEQIKTEWEEGCAVLVFPRFKRVRTWHRLLPKLLPLLLHVRLEEHLPKLLPLLLHVRLEEHGTAVWNLIDGRRTVREIVELLDSHFQGETNYPSRVTAYMAQLQKDGFIRLMIHHTDDV